MPHCLDPQYLPRQSQIPAQEPLVDPEGKCPEGYASATAEDGSKFCVEACPETEDGLWERTFFAGQFYCFEPCKQGTFRLPEDENQDKCFYCLDGMTWVPAFSQCCDPDQLACANSLTLGESGVIHLQEGAHIRILEVIGSASYFDRETEAWMDVEVGMEFGACTTIQTDAGSAITWERIIQSLGTGAAEHNRRAGAPFELKDGRATIQQSGICAENQNCGFQLPSDMSVIASDTKQDDHLTFTAHYNAREQAVSIENDAGSTQPVIVLDAKGKLLRTIDPGTSYLIQDKSDHGEDRGPLFKTIRYDNL